MDLKYIAAESLILRGGGVSELLGEYRHKMDAKGRMSLPSSFRKVLSQDLRITPDPENQCLYVFEVDDYSNLELRIFAPYATLSRLAHERVSLHHRQTCPAMRR